MTIAVEHLPEPGAPAWPGYSYLPRSGDPGSEDAPAQTIPEQLARVVVRTPDHDAIRWVDSDGIVRAVRWRELDDRSWRVAVGIARLVPAGARVGILGEDRTAWIVAAFAIARAGCVVVPIPAGPVSSITARCRQVDLDLLVVPDDSRYATLDHLACARVATAGVLGEGDPHGPQVPIDPGDPFLYQFTSGTTGTPKVAVLSHRAVLGSAHEYVRGAGARDGDALFNPLPLDHVGGSVAGLIGALTLGGTYVAVGRFDPATVAAVIARTAPSIVGLVPTMIIDMLDRGNARPADFASVVSVVGGATRVDPALIDRVEHDLGIRFLVGYGQSEAPCLALSALGDPQPERTRTIGRPAPGRDYCVAGEGGTVVADGEIGELCVRGTTIMSGYLVREGETLRVESATDGHGWLRTGDLVSLRQGVLTFHSRLREVVIRGGENLYPAQIEQILTGCAAVGEVSVFGVPDERLGERLVAAVRPACGDSDLRAIEDFAAEHLPRAMRPAQWFVVDDFPRTGTGKIRKNDLAARFH